MFGRIKHAATRIVRSRSFWIAAGLLVVYAAVGFLLLPYLVERYVPEIARDTFKRQASIGKVRINPFRLTFEANDFRLAENDGTPIVGVRRLYVDFDSSSLLRWAWVFTNIDIDGLDLNLVTDPDERLNLMQLVEAVRGDKPPAPKQDDDAPVRMVLRHVVLSEGRVSYTDRSDSTPASVTLTPVNLEFDNVSTLPEHKGPYSIQARLPGGGTVRWRGEVSLQPLASEGVLSVNQFRPANVWRLLQNDVRLDMPGGTVDFVTRYRFLLAGGKPQLLLDGAALTLTDLSLRQPGAKQPLLELQKVTASGVGFDLQRRELRVPKLDIGHGMVTAGIARDGTLDWQTIAAPKAQPAAVPAARDSGRRALARTARRAAGGRGRRPGERPDPRRAAHAGNRRGRAAGQGAARDRRKRNPCDFKRSSPRAEQDRAGAARGRDHARDAGQRDARGRVDRHRQARHQAARAGRTRRRDEIGA